MRSTGRPSISATRSLSRSIRSKWAKPRSPGVSVTARSMSDASGFLAACRGTDDGNGEEAKPGKLGTMLVQEGDDSCSVHGYLPVVRSLS